MPGPNLSTYLATDAAIRLMRTLWGQDDTPLLADEMRLIFSSIPIHTTGPISANLDTLSLPSLDLPPFDDLNITPFDLQFPELQPIGLAALPDFEAPEEQDEPRNTTETQEHWVRTTVPAQVISLNSETGAYNVNLYPNSTQWSPGSRTGFDSLDDPDQNFLSVQAKLLGDGTLSVDAWVSVFRAAHYQIITKNFNGEISTEIKLVEVFHEIVPTGTGGLNVFAGKVKSGSNQTYQMDIYRTGLAGSTTEVQATQLQIEANEVLPPDSWTLVIEVTPQTTDTAGVVTDEGEYLMQFPVWL